MNFQIQYDPGYDHLTGAKCYLNGKYIGEADVHLPKLLRYADQTIDELRRGPLEHREDRGR
jgi:hypothetical protein